MLDLLISFYDNSDSLYCLGYSALMSSFLILVTASPQSTQAHLTALKFAQQLVTDQIELKSIFFYQDAVSVALNTLLPPSDEPQITERWSIFAQKNQIELQTCVAASLRRGLMGAEEAKEHQIACANLAPAFSMAGLGQLAAGLNDPSVKLIHFK